MFPGRQVGLVATVDAATQMLRSLETAETRDGRTVPRATLTVLGVDQPVAEDLFVVGDSLTADGRIGKVIDAQGIVLVKPVMAQRWTPVGEGLVVKPGDWLQTDPRGANAAAVRLVSRAELVVGPGALVELSKPNVVRIASGDIKVVPGSSPVELIGPGQERAVVKERAVYRVQGDKLVRLDRDPL